MTVENPAVLARRVGNVLPILKDDAPELRMKLAPVENFGPGLAETANDLLATMYASGGVGLAANQVGILVRMFVMDTSPTNREPKVCVNPRIVKARMPKDKFEGCLSFPAARLRVKRASIITVAYNTPTAGTEIMTLRGLDAQCFQHELDHLDGITMYDRAAGHR